MTGTADAARPKYPYFEEETSVDVVNARMGPDVDPRLREVMSVLVKHLHAAVKEIEPTHEEWLQGIKFLTDVGRMCSDWRQEFILLSDTLGVSMLVDAINHRRPNGATENTILGPFYVPEAPRYEHGANICLDGKGEPMVVRGRVLDTQGKPIAGALIEFANDPFLSNTPILGFVLMAAGSATTYLSLPLLLIGRVYVPRFK